MRTKFEHLRVDSKQLFVFAAVPNQTGPVSLAIPNGRLYSTGDSELRVRIRQRFQTLSVRIRYSDSKPYRFVFAMLFIRATRLYSNAP